MDALELTMKCSKLIQNPSLTSLINDEKTFSNRSLSENESKASRSETTQSESSQDIINHEIEILYILASSEEMGEVR